MKLSAISEKLQESLKPHFKSEGFKKKRAAWGLVSEELGKLFNIQCSQFGRSVYFNMGIYLQTEGKVQFPREVDCHLRLRVEQILASKEEIGNFYNLSNFENCYSINDRVEELTEIILEKAIPWFREFNSISDIKKSHNVASTMYWNYGKEILEKL